MRGNLLGVLYSVIFVTIGFVFHEIIHKKNKVLARKFLHIWVSNWYFIYLACFTDPTLAFIGLGAYAVLNTFLEIKLYKTHRFGTVYYPISIGILIALYEYVDMNAAALGCGILAMGYGDGFAAVVGSCFGKKHMPLLKDKTVLGSATMFVITAIVVLALAHCPVWIAVLIALLATVFEAYIPLGLDNISVPLIVYFLVDKLC